MLNVGRLWWDPTEIVPATTRTIDEIDTFEVHHTGAAGPASLSFDDKRRWLLSIERYHEQNKGWSDIFYNVFVFADGEIWEGRTLLRASQASLSNAITVHVPGNNPPISDAQYESMLKLARWAATDPSAVRGHSDRAATVCPGDNARKAILGLRKDLLMTIDHTHSYQDFSHFQDAKDAKANGLWDGSDPAMAASRSVVAIIAQRVLDKAEGKRGPAGKDGKDGVAPAMDDIVNAVVAELQRRLES